MQNDYTGQQMKKKFFWHRVLKLFLTNFWVLNLIPLSDWLHHVRFLCYKQIIFFINLPKMSILQFLFKFIICKLVLKIANTVVSDPQIIYWCVFFYMLQYKFVYYPLTSPMGVESGNILPCQQDSEELNFEGQLLVSDSWIFVM